MVFIDTLIILRFCFFFLVQNTLLYLKLQFSNFSRTFIYTSSKNVKFLCCFVRYEIHTQNFILEILFSRNGRESTQTDTVFDMATFKSSFGLRSQTALITRHFVIFALIPPYHILVLQHTDGQNTIY